MRRQLGFLLAAITIFAASGAGAVEAPEARIGFATPLTGPYASTGARHRVAVELAVEDLNQHGGVLGRPVRLVTADDNCGVEQAEEAAHQLVEAGARFVVGHLCSHTSLVAAAVYEATGVPMMSTTSSHPRLTEEGRSNVFRLIGRDDVQGRIAGDFLAERWRRGKIAILHDGSTYGAGLAEQVRQQLHEDGVAEVLYVAYTPGEEDYSALVEQLQQAAAEVVYIGGYGPDAARILRAAREGGDDLQLVGGHALGMAEFWSIAGTMAEGTIFTGRRDTGLGPEETRVLRALQARGLGRRPTSLASYAAVQVWAQAVERAGTTDPAAVTRAIRRGRFDTVLGWVAFDAKGDLEGATWQWQVWREGDYELLKPSMAMTR
jgi:branched-chain amino acid transport system substrate-binding protein